jgi:uncharacterized protein YlaI
LAETEARLAKALEREQTLREALAQKEEAVVEGRPVGRFNGTCEICDEPLVTDIMERQFTPDGLRTLAVRTVTCPVCGHQRGMGTRTL